MYKYEMHCHTQETSRCSRISGADLIDFYHSIGYTGVVITDHFYNYNAGAPVATHCRRLCSMARCTTPTFFPMAITNTCRRTHARTAMQPNGSHPYMDLGATSSMAPT